MDIVLRAWLWCRILGAALAWCRFCRFLHRKSDNLCGWLARKSGVNDLPPGPPWTLVTNDQDHVIESTIEVGDEELTVFGPN